MGDRANIAVKQYSEEGQEATYVYLYTHWSGTALPYVLHAALERGKGRWGHRAYLTRIIFSEMIKDELLQETGYGISTTICDNGHAIIYVDDDLGMVTIGEKSWTYADYIAIDLEALETILEEIGY